LTALPLLLSRLPSCWKKKTGLNLRGITNASIDRETLVSGEFFYTDEEPAAAHPAGFWHYKHPFPPAFKFHSYREIEEPGLIEVTVMVEIDQGGGMIQRGVQTFLMRKTEKGYQVIPDKAPSL